MAVVKFNYPPRLRGNIPSYRQIIIIIVNMWIKFQLFKIILFYFILRPPHSPVYGKFPPKCLSGSVMSVYAKLTDSLSKSEETKTYQNRRQSTTSQWNINAECPSLNAISLFNTIFMAEEWSSPLFVSGSFWGCCSWRLFQLPFSRRIACVAERTIASANKWCYI